MTHAPNHQIDRAESDPGTVARAVPCYTDSPQSIEPARMTTLSQEPRAQTAAGAISSAPAAFYPEGIALRLLQYQNRAIEVPTHVAIPRSPDGAPMYFVRMA